MGRPKKEVKKKEQPIQPEQVAKVAMTELKKKAYPYKVSKIIITPSRKIGLPKFSSVDISAGMEIVFDEPQTIDSEVIVEAFDEVHKVLQKEFRKQFELFGKKKKEEPKE